jgi:RimJ/RimL family protein N-acetyltransferase/quinol monooxygenase YgiN
MIGLRLRTKTLELVPKTAEEMRASLEAMDQVQKAQLSADWLARFRAATATDPWVHGFSAVLQHGGEVIGTGGFKGPPAHGTVEIAYGVVADQQGKGYGTEIAAALVAYALGFSEVDLVRAHTLPESIASQRILLKCGFQRMCELIDPEDGPVWRFERRRSTTGGPTEEIGDAHEMELFLFARFHARHGCESVLREAIQEVEGSTRLEQGCLGYRAFKSVRVAGEFYVHSRWRDMAAFERHAALPHTVRFLATIEPLIDHPLAVSLTEAL